MKAMASFRYSHWERLSEYATGKKSSATKGFKIKRISPFLLLSVFLAFLFFYGLVTGTETKIAIKLILYPFLLLNIAFADFTIWNYLAGKKIWLIWLLECGISAIIIYWLL